MSLIKLLIFSAAANAICWIILIPLWQYPDEQAHFAQVQNIAESGKSPANGNNTSSEIAQSEKILRTERDKNGNNSYTYHPEFNIEYTNSYTGKYELYLANLEKSHRKLLVKSESTANPPLYYLLASLAYIASYSGSLFDRVYAVRLLSAACYLLTVLTCHRIGRLTFKSNIAAINFAALIAFMPMFIFSSTGVLPDPLTNLLFTLIVYFSIRTLFKLEKKTILLTVLTIILGALTRQQFLISLPIFFLALSYRFYKLNRLKDFFILTTSILVLLILTGKYGTRIPIVGNFRVSDVSNLRPELLFGYFPPSHIIWTLKHTYSEVLPWYWGVYRWLSLTLPHIVYQIINRLLLISLIGFLIYLEREYLGFNSGDESRIKRERKYRGLQPAEVYLAKIVKSKKKSRENLIALFMLLSLIVYFFAFLIWDYFFRLKNNFSFGFQGRYYFPLISAEFLIIVIGFREIAKVIAKKNFQFLLFVLMVSMIIFSDFSLYFVASSYYDVTSLNTFMVQAGQYKPYAIKGEIIYLILTLSAASQLLFLFLLGKATLKENYESR